MRTSTLTNFPAAFVADITIPDGTLVSPGETFTKTWHVPNVLKDIGYRPGPADRYKNQTSIINIRMGNWYVAENPNRLLFDQEGCQ